VVHDVDGLGPGVYRWPDLADPVRAGFLREELFTVAADQALARDAAFVVIGAADVLALDDRGYREAQLAAGIVEGLAPGLYRWPDLERPLRRGSLRDELWVACYGQDLGRDASFVVIGAVDLDHLDDRGYREAQLDAGIVEGRLHLAAYALAIGASGMTFLDSEIPALLGEPLAGLLFTCVGVPFHRTKPAGRPRNPTDVSER